MATCACFVLIMVVWSSPPCSPHELHSPAVCQQLCRKIIGCSSYWYQPSQLLCHVASTCHQAKPTGKLQRSSMTEQLSSQRNSTKCDTDSRVISLYTGDNSCVQNAGGVPPKRAPFFSRLLVWPYRQNAHSYQVNIQTGEVHQYSMFTTRQGFYDAVYVHSVQKLFVATYGRRARLYVVTLNGDSKDPRIFLNKPVVCMTSDEEEKFLFYYTFNIHPRPLQRIGIEDGKKKSAVAKKVFYSLAADPNSKMIYAAAYVQIVLCSYELNDFKILVKGNAMWGLTTDPVGRYLIYNKGQYIMRWDMQGHKSEKICSLEKTSNLRKIVFYDGHLYLSSGVRSSGQYELSVWNNKGKLHVLPNIPDPKCRNWIMCLIP